MLNEKIGTLSVSVKILGWAAFLILLIWAIILWEKRSYGYYCDYFINCISLLETICNKKLEDWPENFDYQEKVIAFLTQKANEVKKAQQEESARPWKENTSDRLRDQFAENHRKIFVLVDIPKDHGPYYDEVDEAEKK
jgi:aspartyl/asparaginyl-tRNA synthetase